MKNNKRLLWATLVILAMIGVLLIAFYELAPKKETKETTLRNEKPKTLKIVESGGGDFLKTQGQKVREKDRATLELIQHYNIRKEYNVGEMHIFVKEVKLIKMTDIVDEEKQYLNNYNNKSIEDLLKEKNKYKDADWNELNEAVQKSGWKIKDHAYYIEIIYKVTNQYPEEVQFFSFLDVQFDGESFFVPRRNFIFSDDTFVGESSASRVDYRKGEKREGRIGLLLKQRPKQMGDIQFSTDNVRNGVTHELIRSGKNFDIPLK
ncbi:hypothetical protein M2M59_00970 [Rummeliibacillus sp. G93]|uniref:hypothetical protein n=1 Tax=Rummeliibacillus sp. G93 TaxID=2939494 RepID=UPI00201BA100|nr:hypothetical protein [Rummeliibacillus sp. G93]UQW97609.1 hypothetical protein M2M59_00970 [Rummeliibacillus sp. G93]